jgi:hypothetical protein
LRMAVRTRKKPASDVVPSVPYKFRLSPRRNTVLFEIMPIHFQFRHWIHRLLILGHSKDRFGYETLLSVTQRKLTLWLPQPAGMESGTRQQWFFFFLGHGYPWMTQRWGIGFPLMVR